MDFTGEVVHPYKTEIIAMYSESKAFVQLTHHA